MVKLVLDPIPMTLGGFYVIWLAGKMWLGVLIDGLDFAGCFGNGPGLLFNLTPGRFC